MYAQPFEQLEKEMLNGQSKLVIDFASLRRSFRCPVRAAGYPHRELHFSVGSETSSFVHQAKDIHAFLASKGREGAYPLFGKVYRICWEGMPPTQLTDGL